MATFLITNKITKSLNIIFFADRKKDKNNIVFFVSKKNNV